MRTEPNAPWWLAAAVTALPVALAVALVAVFPPGYRSASKNPDPAAATRSAVTAPADDGELFFLTASR